MSLWGWFSGWVSQQVDGKTVVPTIIFIAKSNDLLMDASGAVGTTTDVMPVADEHYLRLWVHEMCLRGDKSWFIQRFPAVHSVVGLRYGDQERELANIAGTNKLNIRQAKLSQSILTNYPMTALLPFRGGLVELDCGLASMNNGNLLADFTSVVSDFAGKLTTPEISGVIAMAGSVATGIQKLLSGGNAAPKLFYHTSFTGQNPAASLKSGFIFLSAAPAGSIPVEQLWMTKEGTRKGANKDALVPLVVDDYMVIQIECLVARDDWMQLKAIADPFQAAIDAQIGGDTDKAKAFLTQARVAAYKSLDLTLVDKKRVLGAMTKHFADVTGGEEAAGPALEAALEKVDVGAARALPLPTENEILVGLQ
jgi:hypothetical protein